jgi:segregation and condensation protein A
MAYTVRVESFSAQGGPPLDWEGPLDLLLKLVEADEMEITNVSLMKVTEPFVQHVRENQGKIPPEDLADFLVVAAKLVYLKSKALLPSLSDPMLEEGPDLETQLRMYKTFVEAAQRLGEMAKQGQQSFSRAKRPIKDLAMGFIAPTEATTETLCEAFRRAIRRLEPIAYLPKAALERVVTLEEKLSQLGERVRKAMRVSFHRFLAESQNRAEMVVSFLALLELIKQRSVKVKQEHLFHDIHLEAV